MQNRPFKLCTTSFIVPDNIIPNVEKFGPYFDEMELLVFESQPKSVLPTAADIDTLVKLSEQHQVTYNVHLPVDISLGAKSRVEQQDACQTLVQVLDLLRPLNATTHTLHLDLPAAARSFFNESGQENKKWFTWWKKDLENGLDDVLAQISRPDILSIETLGYPFEWIEDLVVRYQLPVCIDIGHGIKYGEDWAAIAGRHPFRVPIVHLHGVDLFSHPVKDHLSLDRLDKPIWFQVLDFLNTYTGVVSLEVFSLEKLTQSLTLLKRYYSDIPQLDISS
jgi:sugar phosphate isomerase/epimerase